MATDITMPKLSDTMTEGRLISWKKSVGDQVERGDIIAEVETDKANMELESFGAGILLEQRVKPGEMVPVGMVIGVVGAPGEKAEAKPEVVPEQPAAEVIPPAVDKTSKSAAQGSTGAMAGDVPERIMELPEAREFTKPGAGDKASPRVRRLAREKGIDLTQVTGSGPEGRILQEDLARFGVHEEKKEKRPAGEAAEQAEAPSAAGQPLSRMRTAIARKVSESWRQIPHFTVMVAVEVGEAEKVYRELKQAGTAVTLNDIIIKAVAATIGKFPLVNASFSQTGIETHDEINIGVAVSLDEGLVMPVIKGCQTLSVREIAARSHEVIDRARNGTIGENELSGGTFSISNMGMLGVEQFSAIIYPPQGAILAVAAALDEAVVRGGQVVPSRIMRMTLSADHRLIDGAYAARFMAELKRVLENPVVLLI
ncbi:pyruvate dehydrogenase complex, E2 protein, dihydrolipoamide acetyltransferase [Geotalea daltonii FRC-32]|uniref:Dihydrolipoamide acetyltransferase component of pyruvate dehydrogenase complex n=1 Tax=Geotalea daltonii (strain DSM 22248 / JCM 15807 / FRC-32) TaxID=316067 RepID=B9M845_GEODF|nr:dihydrolipoamide acetyltransferase family protein [Geotalea daltonii]ACM20311.1 pyruvate dehydrogenase complex, E2 protein, dihydrolipoamide acetyltransferase [Geotalea daltonii FRC-32]